MIGYDGNFVAIEICMKCGGAIMSDGTCDCEHPLDDLARNMKPLDPEYAKTVDDNFWELI